MSRRTISIIVIVVFLAAAMLAYVLVKTPTNSVVSQTETASAPSPTPSPSSSPQASSIPTQPGTYTAYSETKVASTDGTKILFFHAPWCPQCRALDQDITAATLPDNTTIFKVDYDSNQALRQKYGVTLQTTIVRIDENGNLVKKYVAYDKPTFANIKQSVID